TTAPPRSRLLLRRRRGRPRPPRPRAATRRLLHQRRLIERLGRLRDLGLGVLPGPGELELEAPLERRVLLLLPLELHQPDRQHPVVDPEIVAVAGRAALPVVLRLERSRPHLDLLRAAELLRIGLLELRLLPVTERHLHRIVGSELDDHLADPPGLVLP